MNAEIAQDEKKVEDPKTNPEEGAVKTEDQKAEVKTAETKPKESVEPNSPSPTFPTHPFNSSKNPTDRK